MMQYRVCVDGCALKTITLPTGTTQAYRDVIRGDLAREYQCPRHYLRLMPVRKERHENG